MLRPTLLLALLLTACGDETVGTATTSTTDLSTSTGEAGPTSSGETGSSGAPTSSGSDSATGTTTGGTTGASSSSGTTQGLDEGSSGGSSTTSDESSSTSSSSSTTGLESTSSETTTTGDDTSSSTTEDHTSTGEVVVPPVPAGVCNMSQGPLTTFVEPLPQVEELHMVAMYQATGNAVTVAINRTGVPLTVFLSSYEPVAFTLVVAPGVLLEHVILDGYNVHSLQGQGAATVTDVSGVFNDPNWVACGYFWPMNDGGCETPDNVAAAEAIAGRELTTFAGCYEGVSFAID